MPAVASRLCAGYSKRRFFTAVFESALSALDVEHPVRYSAFLVPATLKDNRSPQR